MFLILLGDKTKIEPGIKALNLGPIEYWGPDAKPIAKK